MMQVTKITNVDMKTGEEIVNPEIQRRSRILTVQWSAGQLLTQIERAGRNPEEAAHAVHAFLVSLVGTVKAADVVADTGWLAEVFGAKIMPIKEGQEGAVTQ